MLLPNIPGSGTKVSMCFLNEPEFLDFAVVSRSMGMFSDNLLVVWFSQFFFCERPVYLDIISRVWLEDPSWHIWMAPLLHERKVESIFMASKFLFLLWWDSFARSLFLSVLCVILLILLLFYSHVLLFSYSLALTRSHTDTHTHICTNTHPYTFLTSIHTPTHTHTHNLPHSFIQSPTATPTHSKDTCKHSLAHRWNGGLFSCSLELLQVALSLKIWWIQLPCNLSPNLPLSVLVFFLSRLARIRTNLLKFTVDQEKHVPPEYDILQTTWKHRYTASLLSSSK